MIDDLNREPERPTSKRYTFQAFPNHTVTVWADSIHEARDLVADLGHFDVLWLGTSPTAGELIEGSR